ncbi:fatty acid hydroxylase family protein [Panacagrimonas perspica]|uniref:Fatty acid hydroxylase family protein n=1 Tax=Panacagrimonas perspica TaxID=381431 RepID=A0A4S3JYZ8_9GAMM|nr:sterol desaturase family protein [Panacagrimonas perspica]TDU31420.1 fatty acid hydroxylase family protein [Panacagrimonas perspica]THD00825.1 hypothetical protein B1810_23205 [Panacagrimonas perspica]
MNLRPTLATLTSSARSLLLALGTALGFAFVLKALLLIVSGEFGLDTPGVIVRGFLHPGLAVFGGGLLAALAIELVLTGWAASSLRRLLIAPSDSARSDLFYLFLALSGGIAASATLISAGLVDAAVALLDARSHHGPLVDAPIWMAAPLLYLGMTFFNYWNHRLLHTRALWRLHAVHHSATEFTIGTAARISPMEAVLIAVPQAIPAALLGASPDAILIASMVASFESLWTHSNLRGLGWLERIGISSPRAHKIHHARDARFHDHNFGDLVLIWDRLFGTYMDSRNAPADLVLGVDGMGDRYDSRQPLRDFLQVHVDWVRDLITRVRPRPLPATTS